MALDDIKSLQYYPKMKQYLLTFSLLLLACLSLIAQDPSVNADTIYLSSPDAVQIDVLLNDILNDQVCNVSIEVEPYNGTAFIDETNILTYIPSADMLNSFNCESGVFDYLLYGLYCDNSSYPYAMGEVFIIHDSSATSIDNDPFTIEAMPIWPGDTDNDGVVNAWDLLPIGLAYGMEGAPRDISVVTSFGAGEDAEMTTQEIIAILSQWEEQWSLPWAFSFLNGMNMMYADCNGDGAVGESDVNVIDQNYQMLQGKTEDAEEVESGLSIYLNIENEIVEEGDLVNVAIELGDADVPMEDIYGVAFNIYYDGAEIDESTMDITFGDSWFGDSNTTLSLVKNLDGVIEAALTRTDKQAVSGSGGVGTLSFVMEDLLIGKTEVELSLSFGNVTIITNTGEEISVNKEGDSIIVTGNELWLSPDNQLNVWPSPVKDQLNIAFDQLVDMQEISVLNLMGQLVYEEVINKNQKAHQLNLAELNNGIHIVRITTAEGAIEQRIVIAK